VTAPYALPRERVGHFAPRLPDDQGAAPADELDPADPDPPEMLPRELAAILRRIAHHDLTCGPDDCDRDP